MESHPETADLLSGLEETLDLSSTKCLILLVEKPIEAEEG